MENINSVVIEDLESLAKKYNKPKTIVKVEPKITVIDNIHDAKTVAESMCEAAKGKPLMRIAALENQMKSLLERLDELEEVVEKVLKAY
jgi:hypothetical protein